MIPLSRKCFWITLFLFFWTIQGQANHRPQDFLDKIKGTDNEGAEIVKHFCASCHAPNPIIPIGAPTADVEEAWAVRLKQGAEVVWKHTLEGINAMPPRGGCFECSDKQLFLAIEAIIPKSLKKYFNSELLDLKKDS